MVRRVKCNTPRLLYCSRELTEDEKLELGDALDGITGYCGAVPLVPTSKLLQNTGLQVHLVSFLSCMQLFVCIWCHFGAVCSCLCVFGIIPELYAVVCVHLVSFLSCMGMQLPVCIWYR